METNNKFIKNVIIPFYKGLNNVGSMHIIYNSSGQILSMSKESLKVFGYKKELEVLNKTIFQIYRFNNICPNFWLESQNLRQKVLETKTELNYLTVFECAAGKKSFTVCENPIFNKTGEILGTAAIFKEVPSSKYNELIPGLLSARESHISFLMSVGASQKEIGAILDVTRGSIAKTCDIICTKLRVPGCAQRSLVKRSIELECGTLPIDAINYGSAIISKLFYNEKILELFFKKTKVERQAA